MSQQSSPEANAAYRQSLCKGLCGKRYAPGMPWCYGCRTNRSERPETLVSQPISQVGGLG